MNDRGAVFSLEGRFEPWKPVNAVEVIQTPNGAPAALQGSLWVAQPSREEMLIATTKATLLSALANQQRDTATSLGGPLGVRVSGKTANAWARNLLGKAAPAVSQVVASSDSELKELSFRVSVGTSSEAQAVAQSYAEDPQKRVSADGAMIIVQSARQPGFLEGLLSGLTRLQATSTRSPRLAP